MFNQESLAIQWRDARAHDSEEFDVSCSRWPGSRHTRVRELADAFLDGRQVPSREMQDVRTGRFARSTQFQDFANLLKRETKRLSLLDEPQSYHRRFAIVSVTAV